EAEPAPAAPERAAAPQAGTEEPTPMAEEASAAARAGAVGATAGPSAGAAGPTYQPPRQEDNALDLGATVLPVIAKAYWKQGLGALLVLLVLWRLLRRRR
ncbi:MAG: SRPBCC family protein, partial [Nocardioidaceae bacterium]